MAQGKSAFISAGEISSTSRPRWRWNAATRRYSSSRSASAAASISPTGLKPVAWPVSASNRAYSSREYSRIDVDVSENDPKHVISPAACHVVPLVSRSRSRRTTSLPHPRWARW